LGAAPDFYSRTLNAKTVLPSAAIAVSHPFIASDPHANVPAANFNCNEYMA